MVSVVIAAHNEAAVLGRCLDTLLADGSHGLDVTVVANGCTDRTAAVARARAGVRVLELAEASKPAALNAGDAVAIGFPRVYLDGDIPLHGAAVRRLAAALAGGAALAAVPRREPVLAGRPLPVRAYYAIHNRLPAIATGLFGRGVIVVSQAGRARFDRFPELTADDLFLDSLITADERVVVDEVDAPVETPRQTRDLVRRLARVRAGNTAMRAAAGAGTRPADRLSWLRDVVLPRPWLTPAAVCYVGLTVAAALLARHRADTWHRDESSRVGAP